MDKLAANFTPFYIMANVRNLLSGARNKRLPNYVLAMNIFAVGSTTGYKVCTEAGIDPDGFAVAKVSDQPSPAQQEEKAKKDKSVLRHSEAYVSDLEDSLGQIAELVGASQSAGVDSLIAKIKNMTAGDDVEAALGKAYPYAASGLGEVEWRSIEQTGFRKGFAARCSFSSPDGEDAESFAHAIVDEQERAACESCVFCGGTEDHIPAHNDDCVYQRAKRFLDTRAR